MSNQQDDFLSALGAACTSVVGRAILFMLAWVLGIVAAHATALHEFVWPWQVAGEAACMFLISFLLLFASVFSVWAFLAFAGTIGFLILFLWKDIHWGFLLVPFLLVWLGSSGVLALSHFH